MSNKNKKYIVPASKPRNPLALHPLMQRGGVSVDSEKAERSRTSAQLAQLTKYEKLPTDDYLDDDNYGLGM